MIIEAIMAIQSGDNPSIIRHKVATFYLASSDALRNNDGPVEPTADELSARLRQTPVGEMDFGQVTYLMTDLGLLARTEGIDGFAALPAALEDKRDMSSKVFFKMKTIFRDKLFGTCKCEMASCRLYSNRHQKKVRCLNHYPHPRQT